MSARTGVAIYFHPEAYTTTGPKLMGRNAAGESFLRGFFAHSKASELWAQVQHPEHGEAFSLAARSAGRAQPVNIIDMNDLRALSKPGAIFYPGPGIVKNAFQRAAYGHGSWSLCGITHTTASARAMDDIAALVTSPVQPWDALICTSKTVKENVRCVLQAQADFLRDRLGITKLILPQLPVIPLGIHTDDFNYTTEQRIAARAAVGARPKTHVVLFLGRLSFHAKAHPLAMYLALERAARQLPADESILLVECGWHANEFIARAYAEATRIACPSVRVVVLDGRKPDDRQTAWACADVFCSLSDNIQETFGIAPIEAMAAGLPVVVSDWDGYKDTVREGVDGFRVPTLMPQAGVTDDLALRHALEIDTYDMYCGHTCTLVAVDVEATAQALSRLFASPELRQQMGAAGREHARETYDWAAVIPQYEALWAQLCETRESQAKGLKRLRHPWPARLDPFHAFAGYSTQTLTLQTVLGLVDADARTAAARVTAYRRLAMVDFAKAILPTDAAIRSVLNAAAAGPKTAAQLIQGVPAQRRRFVFRALAWLIKLSILRVC